MVCNWHAKYFIFLPHTHTTVFTALLDFVRDYPGYPAPERYFNFNEAKDDVVAIISCCWTISFALCSRQITTSAPHRSIFTGQMLFLPPYQQYHSTVN